LLERHINNIFNYQINPPSEKEIYKNATTDGISEDQIQSYVAENFKKLGFSNLRGPFTKGCDFKGSYKGKYVSIEVERNWEFYVRQHHNYDVLIVLNPSEPPDNYKNKLPNTIIHIDLNDYRKWVSDFINICNNDSKSKIKEIIDVIAGELLGRYVNDCPNKERELSACPDCNECAYFGEGVWYEAQPFFNDMAFKFIAKYPINSKEESMTNLKSKIDEFYSSTVKRVI